MQEEKELIEKMSNAIERLTDIVVKTTDHLEQVTKATNSLSLACEKHEKAIGVLLREVKELKEAKNKPLIHKP